MIVKILAGLLGFFAQVFPSFFQPLTNLFTPYTTNITNFFLSVGSWFNFLVNSISVYVDFVCELFAIPTDVFNACCFFLVAKFTIPMIAYVIKLILRWYQSLMPTK